MKKIEELSRKELNKLFIKTLKDNGKIDAFIDQWNSFDVNNTWSLNEIVSAHEPEDLIDYILGEEE